MSFLEKLGKELLIFDGAMGTVLQGQGLAPGELPELWNLTHPEKIQAIHKAYLEAGCQIITANTFGASAAKLAGAPYTVEAVVAAGIRLAKAAVAEHGSGWVAQDVGSLGKLLKPLGNLPFEEAYAMFSQMVQAGAQAGADLIIIETMSDLYEVKAAVLAAKENTGLPIIVSVVLDEKGRLLTGGDIAATVALLEGLGVDALGLNCGLGPEQMERFLPELAAVSSLPILMMPNAGLPVVINGQTCYNVGPEAFAAAMERLVAGGAAIIGGCCGTTPAHMEKVVARCKGLPVQPITDKGRTVVSSYNRAVAFGAQPLIIGERINPTGKSRFKQALREEDIDYILEEGFDQQDAGAHILDVNVGLPEIDEPALLEEVVQELQAVLPLPLQIDTSDVAAMERALRIYNGKAMINSVNGKQEVMDAVFPLVKRYGGVVVCLTLDENGIPETAEGRVAIARRIVETAAGYGIPKKDLVVDTLTMTISTGQQAARVTLDALRQVREQLGVATVLGVSNISFGLPQREKINATFFTLAMEAGLGGGIINPKSEAMMQAYDSYCALSGADANCLAYIQKYGGQAQAPKAPMTEKGGPDLAAAIIKGVKDVAAAATRQLLQEKAPLEIIDQMLIPALDTVGQDFEAGRVFLPQLLMSADAAQAAFGEIKTQLQSTGASQKTRGSIVIATVKGDIHDIGKNIVKVLLENYDFHVIDLGKDVKPEAVVQAAAESGAPLVGLSALMTTTVASMEETIRQLRQKLPGCKVMVGGAVLTQDYADQIGADFYGKDAMASVRYACALFDSLGENV